MWSSFGTRSAMETLLEALTRYWHMEKEPNGGYLFAEAELSGQHKSMVRLSHDAQRRNDNFIHIH